MRLTPLRPYSADDRNYGARPRTRKTALTRQYLQINPPAQAHYLIFDVGRDNAALAYEYSSLVSPYFITINKKMAMGIVFINSTHPSQQAG